MFWNLPKDLWILKLPIHHSLILFTVLLVVKLYVYSLFSQLTGYFSIPFMIYCFQVNTSNPPAELPYNNGQTVYFCCNNCFASFVKGSYKYFSSTSNTIDPAYLNHTVQCPVCILILFSSLYSLLCLLLLPFECIPYKM
jgi:YHS domain-containing protein